MYNQDQLLRYIIYTFLIVFVAYCVAVAYGIFNPITFIVTAIVLVVIVYFIERSYVMREGMQMTGPYQNYSATAPIKRYIAEQEYLMPEQEAMQPEEEKTGCACVEEQIRGEQPGADYFIGSSTDQNNNLPQYSAATNANYPQGTIPFSEMPAIIAESVNRKMSQLH